jgi:hypothetical protein
MLALSLATSLALSTSSPSAPRAIAAPAVEPLRSAERDALRALAVLASGEPGIAEVQEAAARTADREVVEVRGFARRARLAALLPRLTTEYRREDRSYRTVGLQGSGEVDYFHVAPGSVVLLRATWELGELVAARGEPAAASADAERARRRNEAVKRATVLYFERRRAQLTLLLTPPETAIALAQAELEVERLGA